MSLKRFLALFLAAVTVFICGCVPEDPIDNLSASAPAISSSQSSREEPSVPEESLPPESESEESTGGDVIDLPIDTVVSFLACGDNLIHPSVFYGAMEYYAAANGTEVDYKSWPSNEMDYDFLPIYEYVAERMQSADICFINQETLSGGPGTKVDGYPQFNTPIAMGRDLAALGVDIVNMAHNHMVDSGSDSLLKYSDPYFKSLGMTPLGYYENQEATNHIVLYEEQGITFALLTYTYGTNGISIRGETYIPYLNEELVRRQVALAKAQADVVIVSSHWGSEDSYSAGASQKQYAALFCELEVDVVIGTHSHCLQPMEWMVNESTGHRMLLTYSLGNFVSGMQNALNVLEGMLSFDVRKDAFTGEITIENPILTPLVLHYTKESADGKKDTGYRNFKIYELKNYTDALVAEHGVTWYEKSHGSTLKGGKFCMENLYKTVKQIIPSEFLSPEYH